MCKRCKTIPVAHNGYCHKCDSQPIIRRRYEDPDLPEGACIGWQTQEKLPDGRMATVVHRIVSK